MLLEDFKPGLRIDGVIPAEVITVIAAQSHGPDALELTYKTAAGGLGQTVLYRKDEPALDVAPAGSRAFDAAASDFKLVAFPKGRRDCLAWAQWRRMGVPVATGPVRSRVTSGPMLAAPHSGEPSGASPPNAARS